MKLPDYNSTPIDLIKFLNALQGKYTEADAEWYEIDSWKAVIRNDGSRGKQFLFSDGDRGRLFQYLEKYSEI